MTYNTLFACVVACLLQNAMSQVMSLNNCGCQQPQGFNLGNLGNMGVSLSNPGLQVANNAMCLNNGLSTNTLTLGNTPNFIGNVPSCNGVVQGTSQQIGYGDVAIVGEVPVQGPTAVCGNVPVIGYVIFEGDVPAGGMVSVVDPCGCNCNCN